MRPFAPAFAVLVTALAASAAEAPPDGLTWQEANRRSAALIESKGASPEAVAFARQAFDLYPRQSAKYSPENHVQLLLNLIGAREQVDGSRAALGDLDRGADAVAQALHTKSVALIPAWQEGARIAGQGTERAGRYLHNACRLAREVLGDDHPLTIGLWVEWAHDQRGAKGYKWTSREYTEVRSLAAKAGEDSRQVLEIDHLLAKLDLETGRYDAAIRRFRDLVDRLERLADPARESLLRIAYAQLEYAHEQRRDVAAAEQVRQRRLQPWSAGGERLSPVLRTEPVYPGGPLRNGQEGWVELLVTVNPDGTVKSAAVIGSSPPGVFDRSAADAVRQWKFKPKMVDGQPVEGTGIQRVEYELRK